MVTLPAALESWPRLPKLHESSSLGAPTLEFNLGRRLHGVAPEEVNNLRGQPCESSTSKPERIPQLGAFLMALSFLHFLTGAAGENGSSLCFNESLYARIILCQLEVSY